MNTKQQQNFIDLLKEIFQFEQSDLDFGIYKIMNQKRDEVAKFLNNDLVPQVSKILEEYIGSDNENIKNQIEQLEEQLKEVGVAKESSEKYMTLQKQIKDQVDMESLENEVFSNLTSFFKRYYHEGDFYSLRRYKKDVYAIPYEGEEVKFYWANSDQYYVKSSEYFKEYTFTIRDDRNVHFRLVDASVEENNNKEQKGKERRFVLYEREPLRELNGELYIYFEYKIPEERKTQKNFNEKTLKYLSNLNTYREWLDELETIIPSEKNKNRTLLEKHLKDYTSRNTFDYFIHKDLGNFLNRELDFYLKNEILQIGDIDFYDKKQFEKYLAKVQVIRSIGVKIINFLAQLENFQKKLWLKKKFVVESNYCITLDEIPDYLYGEISQNNKQIEEWINLFSIDELTSFTQPITVEFLKNNKSLVLDTKFFDENFKEEILSNIDNIDKKTNGLLIHSDNFQALNLLQEKYKEKIKCTYIDPPYNTNSTPILYKNGYRHSSWLTLMKDRLDLSKNLMNNKSVNIIAIDDNEMASLMSVLKETFNNHRITPITLVHNPKGSITKDFNRVHEYAIFITREEEKNIINRTLEKNKTPRKLRRWGENSLRIERRLSFYPIYVKDETITRIGDIPDDDYHPSGKNVYLDNGEIEIWPIDQNGIERRWNFGLENIENNLERITVIKKEGEYDLFITHEMTVQKTVWNGGQYDAGKYGNTLLIDMLGKKQFDFPKSIHTVKKSVDLSISNEENEIILDYFAGSGTTGHAVIDLNRENNQNTKYILVEMGEYFDSVTKPRVIKSIYSKDWKNGKPISREGSSQILKYIKLESYEDTLNNIELIRSDLQQATIDEMMSPETKEEYILSYMLDIESKGSASLLSTEAFKNPFNNEMNILNDSSMTKKNIDLVDTFNYLLGLQVERFNFVDNIKVIIGRLRNGQKSLVLWRQFEKVSNEALEKVVMECLSNDKDFVRIYINGDNHLENLKTSTDKWEVFLIEEEFQRLMFDM